MTARPRLLMLTTQLGYGGAETSFIRLANALQQTADVTVALFTHHYGAGDYSQHHEALHPPMLLIDETPRKPFLRRWWRRFCEVRRLKAQHDACISFLSGPNLVNAFAGSRKRTVISLRGSRQYDPVAQPFHRCLFQYILDPLMYRCAHRIVPVSAGLVHEITAIAGTSQRHKVRVIPPFVEAKESAAGLTLPLAECYEPLRDQPVIVAVGRMSKEKGFQHLLAVFAQVVKQRTDAKLLLVGDGPMLVQLQQQSTQMGLRINDMTPGVASVIFTGYQPDVVPFMALGRVYALTSATEGFPSVLLEAMAACVPVVAADTPWGARAILSDSAASGRQPYPTHAPLATDYGTLMPRIDRAEYHEIWASVLTQQLSQAGKPSPKAAQRVQDFSRDKVLALWQRVIAECV